jgi:hypothetical protein
MIGTISRVLFGFLLACLTAGLVQVLFILTPGRIIALPADIFPDRVGQALVIAALAATHVAIFSAAFALIALGVAEFMRVRGIGYYLAVGATIAMAGFAAQYASEVAGQPTVLNTHAVEAFLTSGVIAGLIYWIVAGRGAGGGRRERRDTAPPAEASVPKRSWRNRPPIEIPDASMPGTKAGQAARRATLAERLAAGDDAVRLTGAKALAAARAAAMAPVAAKRVRQVDSPAEKMETADKSSAAAGDATEDASTDGADREAPSSKTA